MKRVLLFLNLVFLLVLGACNGKSKSDLAENSDLLRAIPTNATYVFCLNYDQITKKGDLGNIENYKFYKTLKNGDSESVSKFVDFLKSPEKNGLQGECFYSYGLPTIDNKLLVFSLVGIADKKVFEENFPKLLGRSDAVVKNKGNYMISVVDDAHYVWNENLLYNIVGDTQNVDFDKLFNKLEQTKDKSILNNVNFNEFLKSKYDIGVWLSNNSVLSLSKELSKLPGLDLPKNSYTHIYTNIDAGQIKLSMRLSPVDKLKEYTNKYDFFKSDFDESLLTDFPSNTIFAFKVSSKMKNYYNFLKASAEDMDRKSPSQNSKQAVNTLNNIDVQTAVNVLGGDMMFCVYEFAGGFIPMPLAAMNFNIKQEQDFNTLMNLLPANTFTKNNNGFYSAFPMPMMAIYTACKNNRVYVTNDEKAIRDFVGDGIKNNLSQTKIGKEISKSPNYMFVNLDYDIYPESLKHMLSSNTGSSKKSIAQILGLYESLDYRITKNLDFEIVLKLKNKDENALKVILESIDSLD